MREPWRRGLRGLAALVLAAACWAGFAPAGAEAARYCVTLAGAGSKDGSDWSNALDEAGFIQKLKNAAAGDEFWVAQGAYRPSTTNDANASFVLKDGVKLYGGFDGTETALSQRKPTDNPTILTGDLEDNDTSKVGGVTQSFGDIAGTNSETVVRALNCGPSTLLDGFRICAGSNSSGFNPIPGGGIGVKDSALRVINCVLQANRGVRGGGMSIAGGTVRLDSCTFDSNGGTSGEPTEGAGLYISSNADVTLTNCTFLANRAAGHSSSPNHGGGIYCDGSRLVAANCTFFENEAMAGEGGGIRFIGASTSVLANCTFAKNQAGGDAAGVSAENANSVQPVNCILWGNTGGQLSAGIAPRHCVIRGWTGGGTGNTSADPQLDPILANNGGPTHTVEIGGGGSARDAGTTEGLPNAIKALIARDQRGFKRDASPDIGAYEIVAPAAPSIFLIAVQAGAGGSVTPQTPLSIGPHGSVEVNSGDSAIFRISPSAGYRLGDVTVDGTSKGAVASYTFSNVTADHTIAATFQPVTSPGPNPPAPGPNPPQPPTSPDVPPASPDVPPAPPSSNDVTPAIPFDPKAWTATTSETQSGDILQAVLTVSFRSSRRIEAASADVRGFEPGSTTELLLKETAAAAAGKSASTWPYLLRITGRVSRTALKDAAVTAIRYRFEGDTTVRTLTFPNGGISIGGMTSGKDGNPKAGSGGGGCSASWGFLSLLPASALFALRRRR